MNIEVLEVLRAQGGRWLRAVDLAGRVRLTRAQALHAVREFEAFGFGIERHPELGIRYRGGARRLCPDQIEWQLGARIIGRRIACWQRVTSTNDVAARAAKSRSNNGLVVLAEEQTAGRGRHHRRWVAPAETALLMSVLIFPPAAVYDPVLLTRLAAVTVADVLITSLALPATIKWPNDVRVHGRKVCGILVEALSPHRGARRRPALEPADGGGSAAASAARPAVIGIGLNVNMEPDHFPPDIAPHAASLMTLCGRRLDRSDLARSLIQELDRTYAATLCEGTERVLRRWHSLIEATGRSGGVQPVPPGIPGSDAAV